jgi:4-amino-4-deoxy-L-arabinose transferase-like glycosyltransferase
MAARVRAVPLPVALLALVSLLSLAARVAWLGGPCHSPCTTPADHLLIFDERYYVNAARVIAGIHPPLGPYVAYAHAPLGVDPNSEHPQLVKLIIAAAIELFGDGPFAWRIGSLICGSLAILGIWTLARAAGAGRWVAFGAAALMAADNLLLVQGRIATLDIYVVAAMVWAAALYLRGRPLAGGVVLGIGAACKEVAPYALFALALWELFLVAGQPGFGHGLARAVRRLGAFAVSAATVFLALLAVMDRIAPPYDPATGRRVPGGVLGHLRHIVTFASRISTSHGASGIRSYPWEWLGDFKPIGYLVINPKHPAPTLAHDHPATMFLGMMSPPIMLLILPALGFAGVGAWRALRRPAAGARAARAVRLVRGPELGAGASAEFGLAWFLGTWTPYEALSIAWQRSSYIYYMATVMPGIYLAVAALVIRWRRRWIVGFGATVLAAAVVMYPFMPLH